MHSTPAMPRGRISIRLAAGIVLHRNASAYVALLRTAAGIEVVESGRTTQTIPYTGRDVCFRISASGISATLEYGASEAAMVKAADVSLIQLADDGKLRFLRLCR